MHSTLASSSSTTLTTAARSSRPVAAALYRCARCAAPAAGRFASSSTPQTRIGGSRSSSRLLRLSRLSNVSASAATSTVAPPGKTPPMPFVRLAGQEEMKLALLLNVIDPGIGGVLIMGDRGTGKSVAVSRGNRRSDIWKREEEGGGASWCLC